jgi:hypothetical protein
MPTDVQPKKRRSKSLPLHEDLFADRETHWNERYSLAYRIRHQRKRVHVVWIGCLLLVLPRVRIACKNHSAGEARKSDSLC